MFLENLSFRLVRVFLISFFFSFVLFADSNYQDFQKVLELKRGWNLVSLPIQTTLSRDDIKTKFGDDFISIWKYDKGWSVFTPDLNSTTLPKNIGKIDSISSGEGFWVLSKTDNNITFAGNRYTKNYDFLKSGWNLLGAGSKIEDLNATFKGCKIIWRYKEGRWSAYSSDNLLKDAIKKLGIDELESIDTGEGFWVYKNSITHKNTVSLGMLGGATVEAYLLLDTSAPIAQSVTDDSNDIGEFNLSLPADTNQSAWVVLEAKDGMSYDTNYDQNIDSPQQNLSTLHLLSTAEDIKKGVRFTILSQMAYTLLKDRLDEYNSTYTPESDLNYIASLWMGQDIDGDGVINYKDMLHFDINDSKQVNSLKFDISILKNRLENNSTIYEEIANNTLKDSDIVELFGSDIVPPKPIVLIDAKTSLDIPPNSNDINETDVKVSSLVSQDMKVYKDQTTMLIAEDENNNTLLLGYAIPQPLQNKLLRTRGLKRASSLYKTLPSNIEISVRSTALALTMMMLQSGLTEDQKAELSSLVLETQEFQKLQLMLEAAFKADSSFLDHLMSDQDMVDQIKATAMSAWEEYTKTSYQSYSTDQTNLQRILKKTGPGIDWGWIDDTLWYWYGEATPFNANGAPFLATARDGAVLALANPTLINYITRLYDKYGKVIDTKLAPRNSTMVQKAINKGAARRIIKTDPNISYIEYDQNGLSRALNFWHIATAVLGTFGSSVIFEPIDNMINNHKTVFAVGECAESLFDTVDFVTDDATSMAMSFFTINWKSFFETFIVCLVNNETIRNAVSAKLLNKEVKSIPKKIIKITAKLAIKLSSPWGWVWIGAQALNGPIPITSSWIFAPGYAGYDLTWDNKRVKDVVTASQPPKTPVKPIAKIKETENSPLDWSFDASSSIVDSKSTDTKYSWNIDGTIYEGIQVSHTFDSSGKKTIVLSVKDDFGQVSKKRETITVSNGAKPDISYLICTIDKDDPSTVSLSWSVSDRDNDIDAIKVYKNSSDKSPKILNSDAKEASLTYETSKIGHIYNPYIKVIDDMGNEDEKSCIVSAESDYNFSNPSSNLNKGLVAWYRFEGNAKDSSGNGNDGVEHGGVTYADGVIGKAASFDGVDDYIDIENILKINENFTISIWSSLKNINSNQRVITLGQDENNFIEITYDSVVNKIFFTKKQNGAYNRKEIQAPIIYDKWLYFTISKINDEYKIYFDSNYKKSQIISFENINFLKIGRDYRDTSKSNGLIDDLRIYNRVLSEDEIKALYQMGEQD